MRRRRLVVLLVATVAALTVPAAAAGAATATAGAPSWTAQALPAPDAFPTDAQIPYTLADCPAPGDCVTMTFAQSDVSSEVFVTVSVLRQGVWTNGPLHALTGLRPDGRFDYFYDMSCTSDVHCVAVGPSSNAVISDGDDISVSVIPIAGGGSLADGTSRVSCAGSTCWVVGFPPGYRGDVARLADGSWTASSLVGTDGESASIIDDIDCAAPGRCTAIGNDQHDEAQSWTLRRGVWTAHLRPIGQYSAFILSCGTADICNVDTTPDHTINGKHRRLFETEVMHDGVDVALHTSRFDIPRDVGNQPPLACSGDTCWVEFPGFVLSAVGSGPWTRATAVPAAFTETRLSCSGAQCLLISDSGLCLQSHGGTWARNDRPAIVLGPNTQLTKVDCGAVGDCLAIGYETDGAQHTDGVHYVGTLRWLHDGTWQTVTPRYSASVLEYEDVSCYAAGHCVVLAHGRQGNPEDYVDTLTFLAVDGTRVRAMPSNITAPDQGYEHVISCVSSVYCRVASDYNGETRDWDGHVWSAGAVLPFFGPWNTHVNALSCPEVQRCRAAGGFAQFFEGSDPGSVDVAEGIMEAQQLADGSYSLHYGQDGIIADESCPAVDRCLAVTDSYRDQPGESSRLGLDISGSTQTSFFSLSNLIGVRVDCATVNFCGLLAGTPTSPYGYAPVPGTAVYTGAGPTAAGYRMTTLPVPDGLQNASYNDIACPAPEHCVAVGSATDATDATAPIAATLG